MPRKSVREMSAQERKRHSLTARVRRAIVRGTVLLGIVALIIGLGLYSYALADKYVTEAFNLSRNAAAVLTQVTDVSPSVESVMRIYNNLSEKERAQQNTRAYWELFSDVRSRDDYKTIESVLADFRLANDVNDIYLAVYDKKTTALVYINAYNDTDVEYAYSAGTWETVGKREIDRFWSWDGSGKLYYISYTRDYGWLCTSGVPIRDGDGHIKAFVLADVTMTGVAAAIGRFLIEYLLAITVVAVLFGHLLTRHMQKNVSEPLNRIAGAAEKYVRDRRAGEDISDHFSRETLGITTGDEVENLSLVMADMERDINEFEESITRITAEKERISTELALATRIQADMLPNIFPAFPERTEFDIYAAMTPAKEVGGDFYDFFLVDDDHLGLVMADVSGKGVPAALFMMVSKILIKNYTMTGLAPAEVLRKANDQICKNNREQMFVTVWLGVLEISTGRLTAANAGHEYPAIMRAGRGFELYKDKHGFVMGGMEGMKYTEYVLTLHPGDKLFIYTDGVAEATDSDKNMFGLDRMLVALDGASGEAPRTVIEAVSGAIDDFVNEAAQFDDITMLCIEYTGAAEGNAYEDRKQTK
ncbi:MAG: PP2C family protein-serine/threonine phosphatase [Clostridia bacterium]|nr:PP2C family protein-serine/threonine phosphatase [Clostridia bacterium]